jgi:hypothetical protein
VIKTDAPLLVNAFKEKRKRLVLVKDYQKELLLPQPKPQPTEWYRCVITFKSVDTISYPELES